ncbi:MAG: membrane dipeptidase, partial [candidate division Zixibacteria bacterium]
WNLTPHFRNLKDYQLRAIAEGDGVVFINFYSAFLDSTYQGKFSALLETRKSELDSIKEELDFLGRSDDFWYERNRYLREDCMSQRNSPYQP